jgi:hypothetical protein
MTNPKLALQAIYSGFRIVGVIGWIIVEGVFVELSIAGKKLSGLPMWLRNNLTPQFIKDRAFRNDVKKYKQEFEESKFSEYAKMRRSLVTNHYKHQKFMSKMWNIKQFIIYPIQCLMMGYFVYTITIFDTHPLIALVNTGLLIYFATTNMPRAIKKSLLEYGYASSSEYAKDKKSFDDLMELIIKQESSSNKLMEFIEQHKKGVPNAD